MTRRRESTAGDAGGFVRDTHYLTTRITRDGRDGFSVRPGRYRLIVARACPWATRATIVRRLLGLEDVISLGVCGPTHDDRSWRFDLDPGGVDPVLGIERIQQAYFARDPDYPRGITVPAIVDVPTGAVVTNDIPRITLDMSTEWTEFHRPGAPDLYPERLRGEIDQINEVIYRDVNDGVYRCGFAGSQQAYDRSFTALSTGWTGSATGCVVGGTWWVRPSPRRTFGCTPRWPGSTRCITVISSATAPS